MHKLMYAYEQIRYWGEPLMWSLLIKSGCYVIWRGQWRTIIGSRDYEYECSGTYSGHLPKLKVYDGPVYTDLEWNGNGQEWWRVWAICESVIF